MNTRPSDAICQNYDEIADLCRSSKATVYLTTDGEGDLVVMDIESFTCREKMLQLRENLLAIEEDRAMGRKGYTVDELESFLDGILNGDRLSMATEMSAYSSPGVPGFEFTIWLTYIIIYKRIFFDCSLKPVDFHHNYAYNIIK